MKQKQSNQDQEKIEENISDKASIGEKVGEETHEVIEEARHEVTEARRPWYQVVRWGRILIVVYVDLFIFEGERSSGSGGYLGQAVSRKVSKVKQLDCR